MQHKILEILQNTPANEIVHMILQLNLPSSLIKLNDLQIRVQMDGGANTSITNNLQILSTY